MKLKKPKRRNAIAATEARMTGNRAGAHHTRTKDVRKGSSRKVKHKGRQSW
jgi:hypothetical protein